MLEITDIDACTQWLALVDRPPAALRSLDLRAVSEFGSDGFRGCLFLSCELTPAQAGFLTASGATVIRDDEARPYTAHRAELYTVEELFDGYSPERPGSYADSFDARVYRHWRETGRQYPDFIDESLARRLHDHSISEALHDLVADTRPVAIMGGHGLERRDPFYAAVARISRRLARAGRLMLSGGGPGAMEATHLGVWMAGFDDAELDAAIDLLAVRPDGAPPGREYSDPDWLDRAWAVRRRWPRSETPIRYESVGIPTWMYGHEPPNAFAGRVAKYFANSVREEGLLAIATSGVIFSPGSAGTIQEIFQDAAQNHYASFGPASPMVLFGVDYWTRRHPVKPVLDSLADGRPYRSLIDLSDDEDAVVDRILAYDRPV